jgi:hypothetical protein
MKVELEAPKKILETTIPESRPHGGVAPMSGCPVCEALEKIYRKDKKRKPFMPDKDRE